MWIGLLWLSAVKPLGVFGVRKLQRVSEKGKEMEPRLDRRGATRHIEREGRSYWLSFSTIMKLAPELLEAIVAEVHSPSALLQLRAANSDLNTLATPLAFRSICFINKDKSLERFKRIVNYDHEKFAQHIRQVIYQYEEADSSEYLKLLRHIKTYPCNPCR